MAAIISVVGYSNSGKTTLIEKLVPELKKRGYRVGTIKHAGHELNFDTQGKDSWRHYAAGADVVIVSSGEKIALIKKREAPAHDSRAELADLEHYFAGMDVVLAEGYKNAGRPKIEVFRPESDAVPLFVDDDLLLALVTDADVACNATRFRSHEIGPLADLIVRKFLENKN